MVIEVPMTILKRGILSGSAGALFYSDKYLQNSAKLWKGIPITLGHPALNGMNVLAHKVPSITVGTIIMPRYQRRAIVATGQIDLKRLTLLDVNLASRLKRGGAVGVSTGLATKLDHTPGEWMGVPYMASVIEGTSPDHLALLADRIGACSLSAGCGANIRNEMNQTAARYEGMMIHNISHDEAELRINYNDDDGNEQELLIQCTDSDKLAEYAEAFRALANGELPQQIEYAENETFEQLEPVANYFGKQGTPVMVGGNEQVLDVMVPDFTRRRGSPIRGLTHNQQEDVAVDNGERVLEPPDIDGMFRKQLNERLQRNHEAMFDSD